jgi:hypothetical protein
VQRSFADQIRISLQEVFQRCIKAIYTIHALHCSSNFSQARSELGQHYPNSINIIT